MNKTTYPKKGTRFYLASRYARRRELTNYALETVMKGHVVTSRWITGKHELPGIDETFDEIPDYALSFALEDFEDIQSCETLICFTESPNSKISRGGRHVEFGLALALGKDVVIIGPRENVFHTFPKIARFNSWEEFYNQLECV